MKLNGNGSGPLVPETVGPGYYRLRYAFELRLHDDPGVYAYVQARYSSSLFVVDGVR